jgi:fatty-acid desaturase
MASIVEFALAVVGAVFIVGCLGGAALLWLTRDRIHHTAGSDDQDWR